MSSLLLEPNSARYRGTYPRVQSHMGEAFGDSVPSTTKRPLDATHVQNYQSPVDQDGLSMLSFPDMVHICPSNDLFHQFINHEQCSDPTAIHDIPLSPSQELPELRNFYTPRSPYNDLSPFPSPLSDTSYLSDASNSPYTPANQEFPYPPLPSNAPNAENWVSYDVVDPTVTFSSLGLNGDAVAAYSGLFPIDTAQHSPNMTGFEGLSPLLGGLNGFDIQLEQPHPKLQITHQHPHWIQTNMSPEIPIKLEFSPPSPNSPLQLSPQTDLLAPESPVAGTSSRNRRSKRQSKRFTPLSSPRKTSPELRLRSKPVSYCNLDPEEVKAREKSVHDSIVEPWRKRDDPEVNAMGAKLQHLVHDPKALHTQTMSFLKRFWDRTYDDRQDLVQTMAEQFSGDFVQGGTSSENSVASEAIVKASQQRRKRPGKYWCPKWCRGDFTCPDRALSHLWSHWQFKPFPCQHRGCDSSFTTTDVRKRHHDICAHNPTKASKRH